MTSKKAKKAKKPVIRKKSRTANHRKLSAVKKTAKVKPARKRRAKMAGPKKPDDSDDDDTKTKSPRPAEKPQVTTPEPPKADPMSNPPPQPDPATEKEAD